jgi:hypothetical protein
MSARVVETSRPRWGRMFTPTHELKLTEPALRACHSLPLAHNGVLVVKELAGPIGVPDFTALVGDREALDRRLASGIPPLLNRIDSAIISVSHPTHGRSIETLAKSLGWPVGTLHRRIPRLLKSNALKESSGCLLRAPELTPVGRIYAVEAKVDNHSAAINQVRSYSVWADSYVVVMGPLSARALSTIEAEVRIDQGGLYVEERWIRRPRIQRLRKAQRLWATEHFVAAVSGENYQPSVFP